MKAPKIQDSLDRHAAAPGSELADDLEEEAIFAVPIHATWYCTDRCNLRCAHCYVPVLPEHCRPRELDTAEAKRLIDHVVEAEVFMLAFAGGEPLLRPDIFELSAYARQRGLTIQISTNGLTVSEAVVRRLGDVGYQCLQISLDGLTEETNAFTRGRGRFAPTLAAIRSCRRVGLPVVLAFALHKRNLHEAAEIAAFAEREGVEIVKAQPVFFPFTYAGTSEAGALSRKELMDTAVELDRSFERSAVKLKNIMTGAALDDAGRLRTGICCPTFENPTIFPDGSLSPCFNGRTLARGNLASGPFVPAWNQAVRAVAQARRCGCTDMDIDILRDATLRRLRVSAPPVSTAC